MPQPVLFLARQFQIRLEDGELVAGSAAAEFVLPHLHLVAMPALHASLIDGKRAVGNHEFLVDTDDTPETFAGGTGAKRRIEREHIVVGFFKLDAVGLETSREIVADVAGKEHQPALTVAFIESCLRRVKQTRDHVLAVVNRKTVDKQPQHVLLFFRPLAVSLVEQGFVLDEVFNPDELTLIEKPCISLLDIHFELFAERAVFGNVKRCHNHELCSRLKLARALQDVFRGVLLHLLSADGRVSLSDSGVEQPEVFVNLGAGAHGRARVPGNRLLLNGNGWGQTFYVVAFGFAHAA